MKVHPPELTAGSYGAHTPTSTPVRRPSLHVPSYSGELSVLVYPVHYIKTNKKMMLKNVGLFHVL